MKYSFLCLLVLGCSDAGSAHRDAGDEDANSSAGDDGGPTRVDARMTDAGLPEDASTTTDAGSVAWTTATESEPNGGAKDGEINSIAAWTRLSGEIADGDDADVFLFESLPGHVYEARLSLPLENGILPHLAVMDAGRGDDAPGSDYIKITTNSALQFLAMGAGGHYVIVRDANNVGDGSHPGTGFYTLELREVPIDEVTAGELSSGTTAGTLPTAGGVQLYAFTGTEGNDIRVDLEASDLDARLYVFAAATGDWIARNDDRSGDDVDPLLDAPLVAEGAMFLVVENIELAPADLTYQLTTTL